MIVGVRKAFKKQKKKFKASIGLEPRPRVTGAVLETTELRSLLLDFPYVPVMKR